MSTTQITGVGHYLPPAVVTSAEVEARVSPYDVPRGLIRRLSGVKTRRYAAGAQASSDLAAEAGRRALHAADVTPETVDLVIFASASHDVAEPATANIVQQLVGATNASVIDVKNACNSFLNALDVAQAFVETGRAHRVLLTSGEVLSRTINWRIEDSADLKTKFAALTLGDGAGAFVVERGVRDNKPVVRRGAFLSDGSHWHLSTVMAGGTRTSGDSSRRFFECDSARLHAVAIDYLPKVIEQVLGEVGWTPDDVDLIVPHQVSRSVITTIASSVGFGIDRCVVTVDRFGNTAAASIPLALSVAIEEGRLNTGDRVLLVGGAAGFSAAVIPIEW